MPLRDDRVRRSLRLGSNASHREQTITVGDRLVTNEAPNHPVHYHVSQIHEYGHHHVGRAFSKTEVVMAYHQNPYQPTYKKIIMKPLELFKVPLRSLKGMQTFQQLKDILRDLNLCVVYLNDMGLIRHPRNTDV